MSLELVFGFLALCVRRPNDSLRAFMHGPISDRIVAMIIRRLHQPGTIPATFAAAAIASYSLRKNAPNPVGVISSAVAMTDP